MQLYPVGCGASVLSRNGDWTANGFMAAARAELSGLCRLVAGIYPHPVLRMVDQRTV